MRIVAGCRYYRLPEVIDPDSARLSVYHGHSSNPVFYACVKVLWPAFEELLAKLDNATRRGSITTFAISPDAREVHWFPLPNQDTDAVFRYHSQLKRL